ncbi:RBP11-like subunits of RNA polymerase [Pleomassaria siparia CBS 279.74]|uniref:RBP11-like subunits of RNA polymerase n=1 Tax=Pleomassaria siparia CBS 279.74 TaxID=1314801 RepID=A0A6G1KDB7_9PLEO|nr:RBP11-like subunits of RNA polymerase [Pleomassaria siparia CBS 279.74]
MTNLLGQLIEDNPNAVQRDSRQNNHKLGHKPDYDAGNRFELFLLDEGQKKVEMKDETKTPNTCVFTFNKEDHTLGNMLSQRLHKYDFIIFSAYKVPHPLFATFELRVTTDGTKTPKEAVILCCQDIVKDLDQLNRSFTTEWLGKRIVSEGDAERAAREQNNF